MLFPTSFFLLASAFSSRVLALREHQHRAAVANPRHRGEISPHVERNLTERGYQYNNMRATWYGAGLSACGPTYSSDDFIVALAQNTFGYSYPSPYCNRPIVISYNGKTARAKIVDSCVACSWHDPHALDLTEGLFGYFADMGAGVIAVDWSFADEVEEEKTTTTKHTSTHHSTSTRHTTSTHHTTPTTTSRRTTSTRTTTSHTTSTTTSAAPTSTGPPDMGNIYSVDEVILNLQSLLQVERALF